MPALSHVRPRLLAAGAVLVALALAPGVARGDSFSWDAPIGLEKSFNGIALDGVACPSASQCTAVDAAGREVTFNPASPGTPTPAAVDSGKALFGIACPTTAQCTAGDSFGREVTFNPLAPGTPTLTVVASSYYYLNAIACPSTTQCTAVNDDGQQVTFNPQSQGSPRRPQLARVAHSAPSRVCPRPHACLSMISAKRSWEACQARRRARVLRRHRLPPRGRVGPARVCHSAPRLP
jgi:hypothetical protein